MVKDTAVLKGLAQLHHEKPPPPAPCMAGDNAPAAPVMVQRGSLTPIEAVCTISYVDIRYYVDVRYRMSNIVRAVYLYRTYDIVGTM